jgi:hypothetical protein
MIKPTEEGKRRWPFDGYYDQMPCTCTEECPCDCKGMKAGGCKSEDDCLACRTSYNDFSF